MEAGARLKVSQAESGAQESSGRAAGDPERTSLRAVAAEPGSLGESFPEPGYPYVYRLDVTLFAVGVDVDQGKG